MVIYGYIYLFLLAVSLGSNINSGDGRKLATAAINIIFIVPLIGRVVGWW